MSALIRFSAGCNKYDNTPNQLVVDHFSGLVEHMETNRGRKKGEFYVCGPMAFGPHNDTAKYPRHANYKLANHAETCSFLSMDIDYMEGEKVQQSVIREIGKYCAYTYETASSTPDVPRMRVIIQLDREVSRDERIKLGASFQALIEAKIETEFGKSAIKFDASVYRPEQPNYNPLKGARSWKFLCDQSLRVNELLASPHSNEKAGLRHSSHSESQSSSKVKNPFAAALHVEKTPFLLKQLYSAFNAIPSNNRELWVNLGHAAKTLDANGRDEGKEAWLEWSAKSEKFDPDDAQNKWESFNPTSTSYEKIFETAVEFGWDVQSESARIGHLLNEGQKAHEPAISASPREQPFDRARAEGASNLKVCAYGTELLGEVATMSRREWKIPRLLLSGYISLIVGPGGVAKSMLQLISAISVATGRDLLCLGKIHKCNALIINNEDDEYELKRRIAAIVVAFQIDPAELDGTLFTVSGYMQPVRLALHVENSVYRSPSLNQIEALINEKNIGGLFTDPFISTHTAPENDNNAMDQVVSIYKALAGKLGIAINVAHHTRKTNGDSEAHAGDAESGRGASAIKDAARAAVTIARMGKKTAEKLGIPDEFRCDYIRMDVGKMNFAAHDSKANWYRIEQVILSNGDTVGVPMPANLDTLFLRAADSRKKWTSKSVAAAVSGLFKSNMTQVPWSDVKAGFMEQNGISKSAASNYITLLPQDEDAACRIGNYDIWITRSAPRNGWMLHRKGVHDV